MMIEGEEESGSPNLPAFVAANRDELKADVALVCDTGMWDQGTPAITRRCAALPTSRSSCAAPIATCIQACSAAPRETPIHVLAKIIADLHDDNGRIAIPGFYDGVKDMPPDVLERWKKLNLTAQDFLGQVGLRIPAGESDRMLIEQIQSRPTCDANGIIAGYTGEGTKTVIAGEARAKISFRLVGEQDPKHVSERFEAFVRARIPDDCSVEIIRHKGSRAIQLPYDMPVLKKAEGALSREWSTEAVTIGSGGSIPIVGDFKRTLGLDSLLVGFGLDDDRVHSPNEKYDLTSFHKGTRSWVRILAALAD
jgi:acetylornithine deacetylase/succinyl-diaminopimelate desuccinylase-like protein